MKTLYCWTLIFSALSGVSWAIKCYQCGAEDGEDALGCDIFAKAPIWAPFEVECPSSPPHVCAKTATHSHDDEDEPRKVVRGCAPEENAYKVKNIIGCGRTDTFNPTIMCLCDTNLCNSSATHRSLFILLLLSLLSSFFYR